MNQRETLIAVYAPKTILGAALITSRMLAKSFRAHVSICTVEGAVERASRAAFEEADIVFEACMKDDGLQLQCTKSRHSACGWLLFIPAKDLLTALACEGPQTVQDALNMSLPTPASSSHS